MVTTSLTVVVINTKLYNRWADFFQSLQKNIEQFKSIVSVNKIILAADDSQYEAQTKLKREECGEIVLFADIGQQLNPQFFKSVVDWHNHENEYWQRSALTAAGLMFRDPQTNQPDIPEGALNSNLMVLDSKHLPPVFTINRQNTMILARSFGNNVVWGAPVKMMMYPKLIGIDSCYIINLQRRPNKLFEILHRFPFQNCTLFRAIDGSTLDLEKPVDQELARQLPHYDWGSETKEQLRGAIGCAMSHYTIWRELCNANNFQPSLVVEDDVYYNDELLQDWSIIVASLPKDLDILYLGSTNPMFHEGIPIINNKWLLRPSQRAQFGTYSYLVTRQGAQKLVALYGDITRQKTPKLDWWLRRNDNNINQYCLKQPLISTIPDYKSDVQVPRSSNSAT